MTGPSFPGGRHAGADQWTDAAAISDNTVPDDTVQQATLQPATVQQAMAGTADGAPDTEPLAGSLDIDLRQRNVYIGGRSVVLTAKEYLLIELLFTSRGRLFGRGDILERVWGLDFFGEERIVDAYVKRLRSKLGAGAVETVRGLGYRCPLPETAGVAQPNLQRLPPEARLLTRLAQRILQVTDPAHIIADVYELLREHYGMPGMRIIIAAGERVSVDSAVLKGESTVDESLITGESQPCHVTPGARLYAGTINLTQAGLQRAEPRPSSSPTSSGVRSVGSTMPSKCALLSIAMTGFCAPLSRPAAAKCSRVSATRSTRCSQPRRPRSRPPSTASVHCRPRTGTANRSKCAWPSTPVRLRR